MKSCPLPIPFASQVQEIQRFLPNFNYTQNNETCNDWVPYLQPPGLFSTRYSTMISISKQYSKKKKRRRLLPKLFKLFMQ